MIEQALRLPYSVGAHRLLREIVSDLTGTPLPDADPPVTHGPIVAPRIPPRPRQNAMSRSERREITLEALRRGPVTFEDLPQLNEPWELTDAVHQLRRMGHMINNERPRNWPARYVLTGE